LGRCLAGTVTLFRHPIVFQPFYENGDWVYEQRDGQLLFRSVLTAISGRV
jgi:hypothetical protein